MKPFTVPAALAILIVSGSLAIAQTTPMVSGTVTKVDQAAQKITLDHGPVKNLDMDAMTMAWSVQNAAMLKGLKAGDKVKFSADRVNGSLTITKIKKGK